MTREEMDGFGEAIAADEREAREVALAIEVEKMARGAVCHECGASFPIPQGRPTVCRSCGGSVDAGHPSEDPIGPEPGAEPDWWNNDWHVDGRYYASVADADRARKIRDERRARALARIARLEAELEDELLEDETDNDFSEVA